MAESRQNLNQVVRVVFIVFDSDGDPVAGLVAGDFTVTLDRNGIASGIAVAITEIGSGRYQASFTPTQTGYWYLRVTNATYNARGWDEDFDVVSVSSGTGGKWPYYDERQVKEAFDKLARENQDERDLEDITTLIGALRDDPF